MIVIERHEVNGLTFLEVVKDNLMEQTIPTVFFYHGWTNCKETVLVNGYEIAQQNMRAIIPDAIYHGERRDDKPTTDHFEEFPSIVMSSVDEFDIILTHLMKTRPIDSTRIGETGLSMGGITTCAIMNRYPDVKAADCLMGAPNFHDFIVSIAKKAYGFEELPIDFKAELGKLKAYDLSLTPERVARRHFHFWHGTKDEMVPYQPTFDFYTAQKESDTGVNMTFTTTEDGHKVPYSITLEMAAFFARVL